MSNGFRVVYAGPSLGVRLTLALALFQQHRTNEARQELTEAVRLAAPESFIARFRRKPAQAATPPTRYGRTWPLGGTPNPQDGQRTTRQMLDVQRRDLVYIERDTNRR